MSNEYKSDCGCVVRILKWSAKANVLSMKQCSLHKAAPKLLDACQEAVLQIEYLHARSQPTGSGETVLARLKYAIKSAEEAQ